MANKLKVGTIVKVPDGRIGRILFFGTYKASENGSGIVPTTAVVLFGKKGEIFPIDQLVHTEQPNNQPEQEKQFQQLELEW